MSCLTPSNLHFLENLAKEGSKKRWRILLQDCTDCEFKALVEAIINFPLLVSNNKDRAVSHNCRQIRRYFLSKTVIKKPAAATYLGKYQKELRALLKLALKRLCEEAVLCLFLSDGPRSPRHSS